MLHKHHKFMWSFTRSLFLSFKRPVFIYLTTLSLTLHIFFAAIFYLAERYRNTSINSFFDAFYYTVTIMTGVGLGDIAATTTAGRIISMLMMLSGTVIFVCFTGVLAASILQIESEHIRK